jgi:hypothetical protein
LLLTAARFMAEGLQQVLKVFRIRQMGDDGSDGDPVVLIDL